MHCEKTMFGAKQKPLVLRSFFPRTFFLELAAICHEMNFPEKKNSFKYKSDTTCNIERWCEMTNRLTGEGKVCLAVNLLSMRRFREMRKMWENVESSRQVEFPRGVVFFAFVARIQLKFEKWFREEIKAERMFDVKVNKRRRNKWSSQCPTSHQRNIDRDR